MILVSFQAISISITFYERFFQKGSFFNFNPIYFSLTQDALSTCHRQRSSARYCVPLTHQFSRLFLRTTFDTSGQSMLAVKSMPASEQQTPRMNKSRPMLTRPISSLCRERVNTPCTGGKRYVMSSLLTLYHKPYSVQGFFFL